MKKICEKKNIDRIHCIETGEDLSDESGKTIDGIYNL